MCTGGIGGDRSVFDSVISRRLQARVTWYPPTTMSLIETLSPSSMCNKYVIILCKGLLKSYFYFMATNTFNILVLKKKVVLSRAAARERR